MRYKGEVEEVTEASKDAQVRSMLQSLSNNSDYGRNVINDLHRRFYGVADNFEEMVRKLNSVNGETGEFSEDLKNAKKALALFKKLSLGKYL